MGLQQADLPIAPRPVLLDHRSYAQPVVVQTWLEGDTSATPPTTNAGWTKLLAHYAAIHTLTPDQTGVRLPPAVLTADSPGACRSIVRQQVAALPSGQWPAALEALVRRFEVASFPEWPAAPTTLCHVDANIRNFIRRPDRWAAVDWENAGWGDPAFEIADLMTHPAYIEVPTWRWEWVIDAYCTLVDDPTAATRIRVYHKTLLVWWVARFARYLYEIPRGLDERLADRPAGWQQDVHARCEHYLGLAHSAL